MTPRIFCSDLSRNRGEQVFGTAPRAETWLLIEHPGAWSPKGFPDDRLSLPIRRYIEALARGLGGAKKLMIRHRRRGEALRMFVVRSSEEHPSTSALAFGAYEDLIELSPEDLLTQAKPYARPLFLVCTHGKHDKCCAKFGFAVYCALHEAMPEDAWECSHVGGDRFAANVVCFPEGIYFGHVSPAASLTATAEYLLGRIVLESYRGRCCYSRPAQIAEYVIRRETGLHGIGDLRLLNAAELSPGDWRVVFAEPAAARIHEVDFRLRKSSARHLLTCNAAELGSVLQYVPIRYGVKG